MMATSPLERETAVLEQSVGYDEGTQMSERTRISGSKTLVCETSSSNGSESEMTKRKTQTSPVLVATAAMVGSCGAKWRYKIAERVYSVHSSVLNVVSEHR